MLFGPRIHAGPGTVAGRCASSALPPLVFQNLKSIRSKPAIEFLQALHRHVKGQSCGTVRYARTCKFIGV